MKELLDAMPAEAACRAQLRPILAAAEMFPRLPFPVSEAVALRLLRDGGGFDATVATLARCEAQGWFSAPVSGGWSARLTLLFADVLDAIRLGYLT